MKPLTVYVSENSASVFETGATTHHLISGVAFRVSKFSIASQYEAEFEITAPGGFSAVCYSWTKARAALAALNVSPQFLSLACTVALPFVAR